MESPTSRSLKELRKLGYLAAVVEKWNMYARIRQDLFGIIDIIAVRENEILGVQATSASNHSKRVQKALKSPNLAIWKGSGAKFEVWSYRLAGKKGKRKTYQLRREAL